MKKYVTRLLTRNKLLTFAIMFLCTAVFGLVSYDLFHLLKENIALVSHYGVQALQEGGLEELVRLFLDGVLSLLFYVLFKTCEKILVEWVLK